MASPFIEASAPSLARALLDTSWQAGLLVVLVLVVQRLFGRRLSARWSYGLWLVVVLRLALLPLAPLEVPARANPLLWRPAVQLPESAPERQPARLALAPRASTRAASPLPTAQPKQPTSARSVPTASGYLFEPAEPVQLGPTRPDLMGSTLTSSPWTRGLLGLWLLGAALAFARLVALELRFRRRWTRLPTLRDARLERLLERACHLTGLKRAPRLVAADFLTGPAVSGIRRPVLLVPAHLADGLDDDALELILLHELFHLARRDVHANALFALVRTVFWFHPLAHLALERLFAARESLRDWQALAASRGAEPGRLAETLLSLLETRPHRSAPLTAPLLLPSFRHSPDLEKRLLMITRFTPRTHRSWLLGSLLCLTLGWLGFTGPLSAAAAQQPGEPGHPSLGQAPKRPSASGSPAQAIRVQHATVEAEWHRSLRARLDHTVTGKYQAGAAEALAEFARRLDVNLVIVGGAQALPQRRIDLEYGASGAAVLERLLELIDPDLTWCLANRSILVGTRERLPRDFELCMYDISPLLELGIDSDDLQTLAIELTDGDGHPWDLVGSSIECYEGQLFARTDYRTQAKLQALFERLLSFDEQREARVAEGAFAKMDAKIFDANYDDKPVLEVLEELSRTTGTVLGCDRSLSEDDVRINLHLEETSLFDLLSLISLQLDAPLVELERGAWIGNERSSDTVPRLYRVADAVGNFGDQSDALDMLIELIMTSTGGDLWDSNPEALIFPIGPYMVVSAPPSVHAEIEPLIRAFGALEG